MKQTRLSVLVACAMLACVPNAPGSVPAMVSYQGRLLDEAGQPVTGTPTMTFKLYTVQSGGTPVWSETKNVSVEAGLFTTLLGSVTPLPSAAFQGSTWLETVVGATALAPRVQVVSVGYAFRALLAEGVVDTSITSAKIADLAVQTADLAENAVTSTKIADGTVAAGDIGSGQVVKSLNSLRDDVSLVAGANIAISTVGNSLRISAAGGGGGIGGSGTDNYLPRWNGTAALENSQLYQADDNKIGIGDTAPSHTLTIQSWVPQTLRLIGPGVFGTQARLNLGDGDEVYLEEDEDQELYIKSTGRMALMGNGVGVGTTAPQQALSLAGGLNVDQNGGNDGTLNSGLSFGSGSGEGIASRRTAGSYRYGLDFYTNFTRRMHIDQSGRVALGDYLPSSRLDISVGSSDPYTYDALHVANFGAGSAGRFFLSDSFGSPNTSAALSVEGQHDGDVAEFQVNTGGTSGHAVHARSNGSASILHVQRYGFSSGDLATFENAGYGNVARIDQNGRGYFNGGTQTGGADVAEAFAVEGERAAYGPGDVLVISRASDRRVEKCAEPYSTLAAGVHATRPGVLLTQAHIDDDLSQTVPVGITGVIPTRVSGENGAIRRGDLLVSSGTPGHAMKGTDRDRMLGAVIGKALQEFDGPGTGLIEVLVNVK